MKKKPMLSKKVYKVKEEYKRTIISVIGLSSGIGSTHTCIMFSIYLRNLSGKKVAILELNSKDDFEKIYKNFKPSYKENGTTGKRFAIRKVTYIQNVSEDEIINILNEDFSYIILDLGTNYKKYKNHILRSEIRLIVGSFTEWKQEELINFIEQNKKICGFERFIYLIKFANDFELKLFKKEYGIIALSLPFAPDPFVLQDDVEVIFDKVT